MKAQLLKTFYVIRSGLRSVFLIILLWSLIPQGFLNVFAVIYGAALPFSILTLDQRSRWDRYVRMLPCRERDVVLSYYFAGWFFMLLGTVFSGVSQCLWRSAAALGLGTIAVALAAGCILLAVNVPLMLRFGSEKGRLVSMVTIMLCCGTSGMLGSIASAAETGGAAPDLTGILNAAIPAGFALAAAVTAVSIPLSIRFYRRGSRS